MKKLTLLAAVAAAATLACSSPAMAGHFQLGANVGRARSTGDGRPADRTFALTGSYRMGLLGDHLEAGPEVGYMKWGKTSSESISRYRDDALAQRRTRQSEGPLFGIAGRVALGGWFLTAHAGGFYAKNRLVHETRGLQSLSMVSDRRVRSNHHLGTYAGVGVGFEVASTIDVSFNYDRFDMGSRRKVNYPSLGLGIHL